MNSSGVRLQNPLMWAFKLGFIVVLMNAAERSHLPVTISLLCTYICVACDGHRCRHLDRLPRAVFAHTGHFSFLLYFNLTCTRYAESISWSWFDFFFFFNSSLNIAQQTQQNHQWRCPQFFLLHFLSYDRDKFSISFFLCRKTFFILNVVLVIKKQQQQQLHHFIWTKLSWRGHTQIARAVAFWTLEGTSWDCYLLEHVSILTVLALMV